MVDPCWQQTEINHCDMQRMFGAHIDPSDLVWHRDHDHRLVRVVHSDGWQFQMDNQLPVALNPGQEFEIPALVYHRLIKGCGDLIVQITTVDHTVG